MLSNKLLLPLLLLLSAFFPLAFCTGQDGILRLPQGIDRQEVLTEAARRREAWRGFEQLEYAHMSQLGIRLIRGRHIEFYTDLDESKEVDEIVPALDAAVDELCAFFELDPADYDNWHVETFLIGDREPFELFGAMERAPDFENGYSLESRIWIYDKKQAYYNRFLLTHELVHSFMNWTFGDLNPRWYSEGIAEYLGLHRWDGKKMELGYFPESHDSVPGFGRIERIQLQVRDGAPKSLEHIMKFGPDDYRDNESYAWSWALVTLLLRTPRYADTMRAMPYLMTSRDPNRLFWEMIGEDEQRLRRDWAELITTIDYGERFEEFTRDDPPAKPLAEPAELELDPAIPGWQGSGIRLEGGKTYYLTVKGDFKVYEERFGRSFPCESNGITIRYRNGAPLGRLTAAVLPGKLTGKSPLAPWDSQIPLSGKTPFTPSADGQLFYRFNIPSAAVSRSEGKLTLKISEKSK